MSPQSPPVVIRACVLAAGTSSRFGASKLIQSFRGKPLLQPALLAAQLACPGQVTLVVGHDGDSITAAAGNRYDNVVVNENYEDGLGSSIAKGVLNSRDSADAIFIILADQPLLTAEHLKSMVERWSGHSNEIVASTFGGTDCPPILFPKQAFDQLEALSGDSGAKHLLRDKRYRIRRVESSALRYDVDTEQDLLQLN